MAQHRLNGRILLGFGLTFTVVISALVSVFWTPYPEAQQSILNRLQNPSWMHLMGTDMFGRDIFSRVMGGARTALGVGLTAVGVGLVAGVPLGLMAAFNRGGLADTMISRGTDVIFAFPALLSAVLIAAIHGPGAINATIAVGIFNIAVFARIVRGAAITVLARPFIMAAIALGQPWWRVALRHLIPNIMGVVAVQATIQFAIAILAEAGLSYLGLGVTPPTPSWGKMLADAQTLLYIDPKQAIFPGLAILWAVLGLNLLGDGLRDWLDPKMRGQFKLVAG